MNTPRYELLRIKITDSDPDFHAAMIDGSGFVEFDDIDFEETGELQQRYELYKEAYSRFEPKLFLKTPDEMLRYQRWVEYHNAAGEAVAVLCFKPHSRGWKLALLFTDGERSSKKRAIECARKILNVEGVFGELSDGLEEKIAGHSPFVPSKYAGDILAKKVRVIDKYHYERNLRNVGNKVKVLAGKPKR